jgi:amino acid adenylation domain-containing protein
MEDMMVSNSVQERFAVQVARTPGALAVSSGHVRLTYRELDERANQLAHRLLGLGVGPEDPVAVLLERSVDLVVAILAAVKAGAFYLPLHSAYPPQRMQWIMDNAGQPVLLADEIMRKRGLPQGRRAVIVDSDRELRALPVADPEVPARPDQLVHVMYTSGSQGNPMGVAVTHRGVLSVALDSCLDGGRHERVPMLAPAAFGVSTYELWVPLLRGGRLVLAPPGDLDVGTLRRLISEEEITALHLTAGLFRVVADEAPECLAGVREVLTGGDVISATAVQRVLAACPDTVVRAMYGATELSSFATSSPMKAPYEADSSVPVGRAMDNVQLHVLDEHLRPVEASAVGELYISGERLARGYFRRADLTAQRFIADPFAGSGRRMYRTGDLARWTPDGMINFVGRVNDQVKIRGFRVELAEVETALAKYPGLAHVVIVAREVQPGDKRLTAYVVAESGDVDVPALRAHARKLLPEYMTPTAFVVLDSLPLTPNGKLDRRALPTPVVKGVSTYSAPGTTRQEILCSLFAEELGVPRVGVDDSFFDLHGQSLIAMRLINSINSVLGVELSVADLFDAPTVADLDRQLENAVK